MNALSHPNPRVTFALRLNASIGMIYDWKEAVGEGADRDTRGRVCSPPGMKFADWRGSRLTHESHAR
jgi:hypothetical protein